MITIAILQFLLIIINKKRRNQIISLMISTLLIYGTFNAPLSLISILRIIISYIIFTLFLITNDLLKDKEKYYIDISRLFYNIFATMSIIITFSVSLMLLSSSFFSSQPSYIDIVILMILIALLLTLITQSS
ncbi:MAG: hypothetical protein ACP5GU_04160 [Thermoprotei archaeon]|jgi:asparagine N-glycosylation enzyme membrane subunit Stt3